ncbi:hypothetical protein PsorP6_012490 [Peronosclerospora sorghi]|uniref:Uncharacterized protein n=1 Tax=Peronosclerospora sorghi TaxID=230839 RepID=A0ACC0WI50_9STRA|nr:hypothetical protein PsorP6_012490 [Peronosclerospora sorghi]
MGREKQPEKRRKQWMGGRGGATKRQKGAKRAASSAKGHGAVLVTCDSNKERPCVRDALSILNEGADRFFPSGSDTTEEGHAGDRGAKSVQHKLQEEIAALQTQATRGDTGRFVPLDTGVKGVLLMQCLDDTVSPTALVNKLLEQVEKTREFASRYMMKMIPLEKVGYASVEAIKELAAPLIQAHVEAFEKAQQEAGTNEPLEFAVEFKRRNCTNLSSMDVINALVELVGQDKGKVNLTAPRVVFLVEVFRNTCGFSVLTDFHRFKKYNVRLMLDPPGSSDQTATNQDTHVKTTQENALAMAEGNEQGKENGKDREAVEETVKE